MNEKIIEQVISGIAIIGCLAYLCYQEYLQQKTFQSILQPRVSKKEQTNDSKNK